MVFSVRRPILVTNIYLFHSHSMQRCHVKKQSHNLRSCDVKINYYEIKTDFL